MAKISHALLRDQVSIKQIKNSLWASSAVVVFKINITTGNPIPVVLG
jgi:hypothetical protein